MSQKSLKEMYLEAKSQPTEAQRFVNKIAGITQMTPSTVRAWLSNTAVPGRGVRLLLEREFETPWQVLFPEMVENEE